MAIEIPIGKVVGPQGPQGIPGTAAGMEAVRIENTDWQGTTAPYSVTITYSANPSALMHKAGATRFLIVGFLPDASSSSGSSTYDDYTVDDNGTITVYSNEKWSGYITVAGGIASANSGKTFKYVHYVAITFYGGFMVYFAVVNNSSDEFYSPERLRDFMQDFGIGNIPATGFNLYAGSHINSIYNDGNDLYLYDEEYCTNYNMSGMMSSWYDVVVSLE